MTPLHPASFSPGIIGHPFVELPVVDSTNNYAMEQVNTGLVTEGTVYFAKQQTAGKGQRGKAWQTSPGENITLSIVLQPAMLELADQFMLSATVALGILDFFRHYAGNDSRIKWSNDIYWRDRKAGGILIENILRGNNWQYAIIGIGLNINEVDFPEHLPNPVSLRQITKQSWDVVKLAKALCRQIENRYLQLHPKNFGRILADYKEALFRLGEPAKYKINGATFTGIITDVLPDGKLIIMKDNIPTRFDFGELEFVI